MKWKKLGENLYDENGNPFELRPGQSTLVTLDGEVVPICMEADEELGLVRFPAVNEHGFLYYGGEPGNEDYLILTRSGRVVISVFDDDYGSRTYYDSVKSGDVVKAEPQEVPPYYHPLANSSFFK